MKDMFKQINPAFFFFKIKIHSGSSSSLTLHPNYAWFGPCKGSEPISITAGHTVFPRWAQTAEHRLLVFWRGWQEARAWFSGLFCCHPSYMAGVLVKGWWRPASSWSHHCSVSFYLAATTKVFKADKQCELSPALGWFQLWQELWKYLFSV